MRKLLIALIAVCLAVIVVAQAPSDGARKKPQSRQIEGARITGNKAVALPGYELVQSSDNILAVMKKKKKEQSGTLRCGCVTGGSCSLKVVSGRQAICDGECNDGCTLYVETPSIKTYQ